MLILKIAFVLGFYLQDFKNIIIIQIQEIILCIYKIKNNNVNFIMEIILN